MNAEPTIETRSTDSKPQKWHLEHIDALRGIAVLGVVLVHSSQFLGLPQWLEQAAFTGQRGVQLFFLISAFTLFLSYDNRHEPASSFFTRRFFRIAPMFYVATAIACTFTHDRVGPLWEVLKSTLFLGAFSPEAINSGALGAWSIAVEACFYACLPMLFRSIRSLKYAVSLTLVSLVVLFPFCVYMMATHPADQGEYWIFLGFPANFPVFAMGILCYWAWKQWKPNRPKLVSCLLLISGAILFGLAYPFTSRGLYASSGACALLLLALSFHPWKLLVNRCTQFLGKISYSVYLLHFYVCLGVKGAVLRIPLSPAERFWIVLASTLGITIPLAWFTWRFIEEPGIRLGRRLIASFPTEASADKQTCQT
jgi:peptidoglycan/LPS O-acetylase OafA/YrhL